MNSILFVVLDADENDRIAKMQRQAALSHLAEKAEQTAGVQRLNAACWLIPTTGDLSFLAFAVTTVENHNTHYKALFFEQAPDWKSSLPATLPT